MRDLGFIINKQLLIKNPKSNFSNLISGTSNYLRCVFKFDSDWNGFNKVAVFSVEGEKEIRDFPVLIENSKCMIPSEATNNKNGFTLKVYGQKNDQRIVTNDVLIEQEGE